MHMNSEPATDDDAPRPTSRWRRVFHRFFHWRRLRFAFGEILMITVGIHLAFGLDRIGDYYERLDLEERTLVELRNGIRRDRADILENIKGYESRMEAAAVVGNLLENGRTSDKNFHDGLGTLLSTTTFIPSNVPFETLKTRGLDLIRNDQLRAEIAEYYEVHRAMLQTVESRYISEQAVFIIPFGRKYMDVDSHAPAEHHFKMHQDLDFRRALAWLGRDSRNMIKRYAAIDGQAKLLIDHIDAVVAGP